MITSASSPGRHRLATVVFVITLLVYTATAGGSLASSDAVATYEVTVSLVERGSVAIDARTVGLEGARGPDGRTYAPFGLGQSLFNIPFYIAGRFLQRVIPTTVGKPSTILKAAVAYGSAVAAAGVVALAFVFAWQLTGNLAAALASSWALAFCTILWPYSKFGFNAPLTALCLLGGMLALWIGSRHNRPETLSVAGALLGGATLVRHEMVLALIPAALFLGLESPTRTIWVRRAMRVGTPFAVAVALSLIYNAARFGDPLDTGYLRDSTAEFGKPVWWGLFGLLLSPGGSLFLYVPLAAAGAAALATLVRRDRPTGVLFVVVVLTFLVFYATLGHWAGGRSYGPRYLVPIVPFLCVPLAIWFADHSRPVRCRILIAICVVSAVVQLPGVLMDFSKVSVAEARRFGPDGVPDRRYSWAMAPIAVNTRAAVGALPQNIRYLTGVEPPPAVDPTSVETDRDFGQRFAFSLDFWWLYLYYLGALSAPVALVLGGAPLVAAVALVLHVRGRAQST